MSYPRRFFGTGEPIRLGGVVIPPRCAVEVTFRVRQQRLLMRPDDDATQLVLGCFARAMERYPGLELYVVQVMSNHGSFLATPSSAPVLSDFMRDFKSNLGKKMNKLRGSDGVFWERRYRAIPVLDDVALEDRFRYILTQGTKENLVWSARDWPGVTSIPTLLGGPALVGRWRDRTLEYERCRQRRRKLARAVARGEERHLPRVRQIWRECKIPLVPMPHWRHLKPGQRRARVAAIVAEDDRCTRERHLRAGTRPLGVRKVLQTDPFSRPNEPKRSPAPLSHGTKRRTRRVFRKVYRAYCQMIRDSADALCRHAEQWTLPEGTITPPLFHVSADHDAVRMRAHGTGPPGRYVHA